MPEEIVARVGRAIEEKTFPGCVIGTIRANGSKEIRPFGHFTYEPDSSRVREDTIYDLASVTKSIPTAALVLNFLTKGKFELSDPVKKYIPELQNDYGATIKDLLTYTVHGVQMSKLKDKKPEEISAYVFAHGFDAPPGKSEYTNLPAFLLGLTVEGYFGESLVYTAEGHFFKPLRMIDTSFFPTDISRVPPTEIVDGVEIQGIVHDESARVFARAHRAVGHAGLFSTAPDILNFFEALLQGKYENIVKGAQRGLGWQLKQPWFMGKKCGEKTFGKTGFTGTSVVCDVERGVAFVILSNRTYPKRPPDATSLTSAINIFRATIADILLR